jgi:hypothetical protein
MLENVDKGLSFFKAEVLSAEGSLIKLLHDDEEEEIFNTIRRKRSSHPSQRETRVKELP